MAKTDEYKKQAAEKAVEFLSNGLIVGLGTGTTTRFALHKISEQIAQGKLQRIIGIPSSRQTSQLAQRLGIPLGDLNDHPVIDLTIDGADEIDPQLNMIKGGGGALLREKIIIQASKRVIIIVDESKVSKRLGKKFPVPIEVLPFCWKCEANFLESIHAKVTLRQTKSGKIFKTDQHNYILDAYFGPIKQPEELVKKLSQRAGIMAHGIFLELATDVIIAGKKGIAHHRRYDLL